MKKVLLALICLTVTLSLLILPVIASTSGAFVASRSTVGRGDTFTVTVSINGAEGVGSIGIIPEYDKTAFEFVSGQWLIEGALSEADISKTGAALFAFDGKENVNGDVYSFTLKVKPSANYGSYSISGTVDAEGNIPASTATVKVAEPGAGIVGQLTSYNPNNAATVQLLQSGEASYTQTNTSKMNIADGWIISEAYSDSNGSFWECEYLRYEGNNYTKLYKCVEYTEVRDHNFAEDTVTITKTHNDETGSVETWTERISTGEIIG